MGASADLPRLRAVLIGDRGAAIDDFQRQGDRRRLRRRVKIVGNGVFDVAAVAPQDGVELGPVDPQLAEVGSVQQNAEQRSIRSELGDLKYLFVPLVTDLDVPQHDRREPAQGGRLHRHAAFQVGRGLAQRPAEEETVGDDDRQQPEPQHC
jgi:hypothetical protein